jgi:tetratricopeptide (TPR) repeat protein
MTKQRDDLGALFALDGAPGPARRIPSAKAASIVEAALAGANFADGTAPSANSYDDDDEAPTRVELRAAPRQEAPVQAPVPVKTPDIAPAPRRASKPPRAMLAAAALALLVGGTAAGAYLWVKNSAPAMAPSFDAGTVGSRKKLPAPTLAPAAEPQVAPLAPEALPELDMPVDKIDAPRRAKAPEVVEKEAEDLLARANALRGDKQWQDADAVYDEVAKKYPRSAAAYVAQVASAGLRLDHLNDAAGAKKLYQTALASRPTGPLAEEARYGLARALRALGDAEGERAALEAFVATYPDSPLRARAQKRLVELGRP